MAQLLGYRDTRRVRRRAIGGDADGLGSTNAAMARPDPSPGFRAFGRGRWPLIGLRGCRRRATRSAVLLMLEAGDLAVLIRHQTGENVLRVATKTEKV